MVRSYLTWRKLSGYTKIEPPMYFVQLWGNFYEFNKSSMMCVILKYKVWLEDHMLKWKDYQVDSIEHYFWRSISAITNMNRDPLIRKQHATNAAVQFHFQSQRIYDGLFSQSVTLIVISIRHFKEFLFENNTFNSRPQLV